MLTTTTGVISFDGLNLAVTLQPYLTIVSDPVTTVETFNSAMLCDFYHSHEKPLWPYDCAMVKQAPFTQDL